MTRTRRRRTHGYAAPLGAATRGHLLMERGTPGLRVTVGGSSPDLVRASFRGRIPDISALDGNVIVIYPWVGPAGWFTAARSAHGEVELNPAVPWSLEFRGGVHRLEADLRPLALQAVDIRGGITGGDLCLPEPRGTVFIGLAGGVNHVVLRYPDGTPVRLSVRGGISTLRFDAGELGSIAREVKRETVGWASAVDRFDVSIRGGANHVEIVGA